MAKEFDLDDVVSTWASRNGVLMNGRHVVKAKEVRVIASLFEDLRDNYEFTKEDLNDISHRLKKKMQDRCVWTKKKAEVARYNEIFDIAFLDAKNLTWPENKVKGYEKIASDPDEYFRIGKEMDKSNLSLPKPIFEEDDEFLKLMRVKANE